MGIFQNRTRFLKKKNDTDLNHHMFHIILTILYDMI